jgi:hypothetical protein
MIRSADQLLAHLEAGGTVSRQGLYEGNGFRIATSGTNETVHRGAMRALGKRGKLVVIGLDLAGRPYEWAGD